MTDQPMSDAELLAKLRSQHPVLKSGPWMFDVDNAEALAELRQYRDAHRREERERCAMLIEEMVESPPHKGKTGVRLALAIAARAVRRGRHLTESEKLSNLKSAMEEWAGEDV